MKFLYLYLADYRSLRDESLNFDTWRRFHYEKGCLSCVKDMDSEGRNFFKVRGLGSGVVDSISAIIGDNGSGKTTIARAMTCLVQGKPELGDFVAVVSLRNIGDRQDHLEIYYRLKGVAAIKLKDFKCPKKYCFNMGKRDVKFSLNQRLRLVYYSPLFTTERTMPVVSNSFVPEPNKLVGGDDFQVSQRVAYSVRDVSMSSFVSSALSEVYQASPENAILLSERKRLLKFLCDISYYPDIEEALDLHFNLAGNYAVVSFNQSLWDNRISGLRSGIESYLMRPQIDGSQLLAEDESWEGYFLNLNPMCMSTVPLKVFFFFALEYLTSRFAYKPEVSSGLTEASKELIKVVILASSLWMRDKITETEESLIIDEMADKGSFDLRFEVLADLMRKLKTYTRYDRWSGVRHESDIMHVEFRNRDSKAINDYLELMGCYLGCRGEDDFLHFTFAKPPSAGESIALSMWARLYTAFSDSVNGKGEFHDIILFLDEVETSLHPSWQRTLVERIVKMWQRLAIGCHVHIVFGSHSPVLLSDIPAGNVVWLQADQENMGEKVDFNTFGANIFDLYRLAFNQKNGTTGSFASTKIKEALAEVAEVVKSKISCRGTSDEPKELSDASKLTLSLIGDDIIKRYLNGLRDGGLL